MVEADLERAEERAELGEKYVVLLHKTNTDVVDVDLFELFFINVVVVIVGQFSCELK